MAGAVGCVMSMLRGVGAGREAVNTRFARWHADQHSGGLQIDLEGPVVMRDVSCHPHLGTVRHAFLLGMPYVVNLKRAVGQRGPGQHHALLRQPHEHSKSQLRYVWQLGRVGLAMIA